MSGLPPDATIVSGLASSQLGSRASDHGPWKAQVHREATDGGKDTLATESFRLMSSSVDSDTLDATNGCRRLIGQFLGEGSGWAV